MEVAYDPVAQAIYERVWKASALELACQTEVDAFRITSPRKTREAKNRFIRASKR